MSLWGLKLINKISIDSTITNRFTTGWNAEYEMLKELKSKNNNKLYSSMTNGQTSRTSSALNLTGC